jgi:hypothetical protein
MKLAGIVFLLCGVFLFLSVSPIVREVKSVSKLHGKYIANHEFAKTELSINSDGTYDQKVILIPSSRTDTVSGTWSYDNEDSRFTFDHNFMSVVDGFGRFDPNYAKPRESGWVSLPAYRWFFRIYIGSCEGTEYRKVD